jgi:hypothetical protein
MKDRIQQAICFGLYGLAIYLWVFNRFWYLFAVLFILHLVELLLEGWQVGKRAGKSAWVTIFMTLICGFTWWLPLKKNIDEIR